MKKTETSKVTPEGKAAITTIKSFKATEEVQDFYRFIHENKLRPEAKTLIEIVLKQIKPVKKRGRKKIVH